MTSDQTTASITTNERTAVTVSTLFRFLIGDRQAIEALALSRSALWVGMLFVLSAGLAREYDGAYFLGEPWHLLIPLGASLVASFILYVIADLFIRRDRAGEPREVRRFRAFLTLFWLTAPMAWLYGIPFERFMAPYDATVANYATLALVSVWRVLLITRVVSVLFNFNVIRAFFMVMLFADAVAVVGAFVSPAPIFSFMGGVRHLDHDRLILNVTHNVIILGIMSSPVWLIGAVVAAFGKGNWKLDLATDSSRPVSKLLVSFAFVSILAWVPAFPVTQAEQGLKWHVETLFDDGQIDDALHLLSVHELREFPPHYMPRPRNWPGARMPRLYEIMKVVLEREERDWVHAYYMKRFGDEFGEGYHWHSQWQISEIVEVLEHMPESAMIARKMQEQITERMSYERDRTTKEYQSMRRILEIAGVDVEERERKWDKSNEQ